MNIITELVLPHLIYSGKPRVLITGLLFHTLELCESHSSGGQRQGSLVLRPVQGKQDPKDLFAHHKILDALA